MPYCNVLREAITEDDDDERWDKSCTLYSRADLI